MSLEKFMVLVQEQMLHLHRIDKFEDSAEGTLSIIDKKLFRYDESNNYWERERKRHYVNCWIESPYELSLMWQCYGYNGIAIKTTVSKLRDSLSNDTEHKFNLSRVKYIDYESGESSQDNGTHLNVLKLLFTKRMFFQQEQEVRLLYSNYNNNGNEPIGYDFPIAVKVLIDEIRISPYADDVIKKIVETEMRNLGLGIRVNNSEL